MSAPPARFCTPRQYEPIQIGAAFSGDDDVDNLDGTMVKTQAAVASLVHGAVFGVPGTDCKSPGS